AEIEMPRDICPFETGQGTHPDIIELREQERINEMPAIDCEFRIIDGLLRDLQSRRTRPQKSAGFCRAVALAKAGASPVELGFQFLCATDEIRQIEPEQVMTFDHIRVALFDERSESPQRVALRFLNIIWIDND